MPEEAWTLWPWMHLAGRICFSLFFIVFGLNHLFGSRQVVGYFQRKDVPGPRPVAVATGLMLLVGGLLVLTGWSRFIGAGLLFLVLFPGAFALHPFWRETDPATRLSERAQFFMTLALAGAALLVGYYGHTWWPLAVVH
jgi:uncharacterized membrane protein YphA (DoxX/SURF4 family)